VSDGTPTPRELRDDLRGVLADIIAIKPHLTTPYPDDPRWTPWSRFAERALRTVENVRDALKGMDG
jgi:hypothetical protein